MKDDIQEPRSVTILRHINNWLLDSSTSVETYAQNVVELFHARVPVKARTVKFHEGGDAGADFKANGQLMGRYLNRTVRLPADLEEPMVMVLPDNPRQELLSLLAIRYDMLPAQIPQDSVPDDMANLSQILKETSDVVRALGPIYDDGKVDEKDQPYAKHALLQINECIGSLVSMQARITRILSDGKVTQISKVKP